MGFDEIIKKLASLGISAEPYGEPEKSSCYDFYTITFIQGPNDLLKYSEKMYMFPDIQSENVLNTPRRTDDDKWGLTEYSFVTDAQCLISHQKLIDETCQAALREEQTREEWQDHLRR